MLVQKMLSTMRKYSMLSPGDRVLVAVSGGPDSMALLRALWHLREQLCIDIAAFHLDHMFRGEESRKDAETVREYCSALGVKAIIERYDVPSFVEESRLSAEDAARMVRYELAASAASSLQCTCIALAHHRDDNLETVVMRFLRGSGLRGLAGIRPVRMHSSPKWSGRLIRPLLECSRAEIEQYCQQQSVPFRIDQSNLSDEYTRNRVRLDLIPRLLEYNPNLSETIACMAGFMAEEDDYIETQAKAIMDTHSVQRGDTVEISLQALAEAHPAVARRAILLLIERVRGARKDIYSTHIEDVLDLIRAGDRSGLLSLPGGTSVRKRYGMVEFGRADVLRPKDVTPYLKYLTVPGLTVVPYTSSAIVADVMPVEQTGDYRSADPSVAYMDYDVVADGLAVRNRRDGDRFAPLGMHGSKKLKEFFIDNKIRSELRDRIPLVVYGDGARRIAWVGELRLSEDVKITERTRSVLRLSLEPLSGSILGDSVARGSCSDAD